MKKVMNYRHGDLALIGIKTLPKGLHKSDSRVLMVGSGGHAHSFDKGEFSPANNGVVIGYLVTNNTTLYHPEHGTVIKGNNLREAPIADGVYELRRQFEDTHDGMKPVVD